MIRLEKCTKLFGKCLALNSVTFEVSSPGLILILGSNGAGKSTLLRACAGLLVPSSGTVKLSGPVSYMGHQSMLYPQLSVAENLRFFESLQTSKAHSLNLKWLELDLLLPKLVSDLSQGQRSRVALARALQFDSDRPLLLDEPSSAFDQSWQKVFMEKLKEFCRNRPVLMITHDPERYLNFASRALVLSQGSLSHDLPLNLEADRSMAMQAYHEVLR